MQHPLSPTEWIANMLVPGGDSAVRRPDPVLENGRSVKYSCQRSCPCAGKSEVEYHFEPVPVARSSPSSSLSLAKAAVRRKSPGFDRAFGEHSLGSAGLQYSQ